MNHQLLLTPLTMTKVLAYCQYYTPNFLSGRCLSATHLRRLSGWLGLPQSKLRTARSQPLLAAHLALAQATGLVQVDAGCWQPGVLTLSWLKQAWPEQLEQLLQARQDSLKWPQSLAQLGLVDLFGLDYETYIDQQLMRAIEAMPTYQRASWRSSPEAATWQLAVPVLIHPEHLFHLIQSGSFQPNNLWEADAYSIGRAAQHGYSLTQIEHLLVHSTGEPLAELRRQQLLGWYQQHDAYQLRPVYLLSTKRPEAMDFVFQQQRWRHHIGQRLATRHATVSPDLIPLLERALAKQGIPLMAAAATTGEQGKPLNEASSCWLALSIVQQLGRLVELPFTLPTETIHQLESQLSPEQQAVLAQFANQAVGSIKTAIQGRDAYFLPEQPVDPGLGQAIRQAIAAEQMLRLWYQALGELVPRQRDVEPFWLEERASGQYLHAYCHLAEANRIFRLDRIHTCEQLDRKSENRF